MNLYLLVEGDRTEKKVYSAWVGHALFLGHREMMSPQPRDPTLAEWRRFYDVRSDDPESMDAPRDRYRTKAAFHGDYLKAMLRERSPRLRERSPRLRYTKARPGPVLEPAYLDALRARTVGTPHLDSLRHLLSIWDGMGGAR